VGIGWNMPEAGFELYNLSTHVSCNPREEFEVKNFEASVLNSGIRYDCDEVGPQGLGDESPPWAKEKYMCVSEKREKRRSKS
jgi:hypothetical protein